MSRLPLALTCGDPAGVGPELIESWLRAHPALAATVVPIGPAKWIARLGQGQVVGPADYEARLGQPDTAGQLIALEAMELAARGTTGGRFSGVVTGPINKKGLADVGYTFPGQTEFFANRWGGAPVMAFAGGRLTVGLATWHIPLHTVATTLTSEDVRRTVLALITLRKKLGDDRPRIAVCGLNPHAGEGGLLGTEDDALIQPVVERLRAEGHDVSGPLPGDTVFHRHLQGEFDAVAAIYHDQGLAPLKTVDFSTAANLSLGLRHVRTSPDHGTAYDLAGQGTADRGSFDAAVRLAFALTA
ncbi:4-hydroxythreonine-4-phosphate dehydrogenase [Verrucomicrobiota bacterium]|nr:4-hydroxythreonine-4-phosphate dehydrogenase [Verrucomicrobiota bacterium]